MLDDELYMRRCFELAQSGLGKTAINPLVGSVIVYEGVVLGEGYHEQYGGPHAEVNAINSVANPNLLTFSTLYVNLEPCAHFGKTPPCCDLIIQKGLRRVVIAMQDPFPLVDGEGIRKMREAGIEVLVGVLEEEARCLNRRFIKYHSSKYPYVILKWMQSVDGYIGSEVERIGLSNEDSLRLSHTWRREEAAILIGPNTAITDNPSLTTRHVKGRNPLRILLDRHLRVPQNRLIFHDGLPLWVMNVMEEKQEGAIRYLQLSEANFLDEMLQRLHQEGVSSVLVEGGSGIHQAFIEGNYWDELRIGISPIQLGQGVKAPAWPSASFQQQEYGTDLWNQVIRFEA